MGGNRSSLPKKAGRRGNSLPSFCTIITVKYSLDTLLLLPQPYILLFTAAPQVLCIVEAVDCMPVSRYSLSRNPVCTQEQTGSRTYMSEKTAKRNEGNRFLHFHVSNFFKFMAANLSFTQFVTWAKPLYCV